MTGSLRKQFLSAATSDDITMLNKFMADQKFTPQSLSELLQTVSRKDNEKYWSAIADNVQNILTQPGFFAKLNMSLQSTNSMDVVTGSEAAAAASSSSSSSSTQDNMSSDEFHYSDVVYFLGHVCFIGQQFVSDSSNKVSAPLFNTASMLHDVIFQLDALETMTLQNEIAKLCETFCATNRPDCILLTPQTVCYLLIRASNPQAKLTDIKRVFNFRNALLEMNFEDESAQGLKTLLLRCLISPHFLRAVEGRKFLCFVFGIQADFIHDIHVTIKNQIPVAKKSMITAWADIYFRAWKLSSGLFRETIEYSCIQDFAHCAIHVTSVAVATACRKILSVFHEQKKTKDVDEMLLRLYQPIVFRSLKAANSKVRKNAATVFIDAFPLQDPQSKNDEIDALLQKQVDLLDTLLHDDAPGVRCVAIKGCCRILNLFWEVLPPATIHTFLTNMSGGLAYDAASTNVRVAVCQGFTYLLKNHLAQTTLQQFLPHMSHLINDTSERVRVAMLDLLIAVSSIRAFSFFDIVTVEDLLTRMAMDTQTVGKRITCILRKSYFPWESNRNTQVTRCLQLIQTNPQAALVFFSHVHMFCSFENTLNFVRAVYKVVLKTTKQMSTKKRKHDDFDSQIDEQQDGVYDSTTREYMMRIAAVMLTKIQDQLILQENSHHFNKLISLIDEQDIQLLLDAYPSIAARGSILSMASVLPQTGLPTVSGDCLPKLASCHPEDVTEMGAYIDSLCSWGLVDQLQTLLITSLTPYATGIMDSKTQPKNKRRRGKKGKSASDVDSDPLSLEQACFVINYVLHSDSTRRAFVQAANVSQLCDVLQKFFLIVEERVTSASNASSGNGKSKSKKSKAAASSSIQSDLTNDQLTSLLSLFFRLSLHLSLAEQMEKERLAEGEDASSDKPWMAVPQNMEDIASWACDLAVTGFDIKHSLKLRESSSSSSSGSRKSGRKRKNVNDNTEGKDAGSLGLGIAQLAIGFSTEMLALCMCTESFATSMAVHIKKLMKLKDDSIRSQIFPHACKLLYHFAHVDVSQGTIERLLATLLKAVPKMDDGCTSSLAVVLKDMAVLHQTRGTLPSFTKFLAKYVLATVPLPENNTDSALASNPEELGSPLVEFLLPVLKKFPALYAAFLDHLIESLNASQSKNLSTVWQSAQTLSVFQNVGADEGGKLASVLSKLDKDAWLPKGQEQLWEQFGVAGDENASVTKDNLAPVFEDLAAQFNQLQVVGE